MNMRSVTMMDEPIQKVYWSTTEIAELLHESASCVRHWGLVFQIAAKITTNNSKLYTKQAVAKFHMVKTLIRTERFTLEGARIKLQNANLI
jgi:hypothetical protein